MKDLTAPSPLDLNLDDECNSKSVAFTNKDAKSEITNENSEGESDIMDEFQSMYRQRRIVEGKEDEDGDGQTLKMFMNVNSTNKKRKKWLIY